MPHFPRGEARGFYASLKDSRFLPSEPWSLERFQVYSVVWSRHGYLISQVLVAAPLNLVGVNRTWQTPKQGIHYRSTTTEDILNLIFGTFCIGK